jgi:hypothetical protein
MHAHVTQEMSEIRELTLHDQKIKNKRNIYETLCNNFPHAQLPINYKGELHQRWLT